MSGGACCAYVHGEKVVDLCGGVRNKATGAPWEQDTMVVVHSASKGLAAMTLALAHSRGLLDYEERVAAYWPEFGQHGKDRITVMARHEPAWEPGTRQAYHALTLGFYEGELIRRIDPRHRTLGQFLHDEIAAALGEELYIRLPIDLPNTRLAVLAPPGPLAMLTGFPPRLRSRSSTGGPTSIARWR